MKAAIVVLIGLIAILSVILIIARRKIKKLKQDIRYRDAML